MPHSDELATLLRDVQARALRYATGVDERRVAPTSEAVGGLARFAEDLPEDGHDAAATIALLDEAGSPATMATTGPRYFGFVTGGVLPVALASAWLTSTWDQNAALPVMSPVADALHDVARRWLLDLLGLPPETAMALCSGASMGNMTALIAARDKLLADAGWDVQADGLVGAPPVTVVVGANAHSTVIKALGLIGLGRRRLVEVQADGQGRLRAQDLPDVAGPVLVCAQAGEVNAGAFDPFAAIVGWARERDAWVHVDGAFGLWALADPTRAHRLDGVTEADSWVTDGHKFLNLTYDHGIALVRRAEDLRRSFASTAGYLPPDHGFEALHHGPQASQRARQIELWAAFRTLGRSGVARLVQQACASASRIAEGLAAAGLEVVNEVVLNQVLIRMRSDEHTRRLIEAVQRDGTCWCGPTDWHGRPAMRISVSSWRTGDAAAEQSLAAIVRCAAQVDAGLQTKGSP